MECPIWCLKKTALMFLAYLPSAPQAWSEAEAGNFEASSKESLLTQECPKPSLKRAHSSFVLTFPQPMESAVFLSRPHCLPRQREITVVRKCSTESNLFNFTRIPCSVSINQLGYLIHLSPQGAVWWFECKMSHVGS